eukprot:CAMPEP_0168240938 /NCGR_PEP_ID=MMETSP0140_2-20121125/22510_1 /TAXON_ID=44445 /ORGANISM="Pseudo-nitzschia australis, Strain 10249 10 AB" /LENGTH=109 /DNA_ID=CAMNT_0008175719 /DNA_START=64 /DNA_END=393 /DNA_ORIENTATION=+
MTTIGATTTMTMAVAVATLAVPARKTTAHQRQGAERGDTDHITALTLLVPMERDKRLRTPTLEGKPMTRRTRLDSASCFARPLNVTSTGQSLLLSVEPRRLLDERREEQ